MKRLSSDPAPVTNVVPFTNNDEDNTTVSSKTEISVTMPIEVVARIYANLDIREQISFMCTAVEARKYLHNYPLYKDKDRNVQKIFFKFSGINNLNESHKWWLSRISHFPFDSDHFMQDVHLVTNGSNLFGELSQLKSISFHYDPPDTDDDYPSLEKIKEECKVIQSIFQNELKELCPQIESFEFFTNLSLRNSTTTPDMVNDELIHVKKFLTIKIPRLLPRLKKINLETLLYHPQISQAQAVNIYENIKETIVEIATTLNLNEEHKIDLNLIFNEQLNQTGCLENYFDNLFDDGLKESTIDLERAIQMNRINSYINDLINDLRKNNWQGCWSTQRIDSL